MGYIKHLAMMALGFVLYWLVAGLMPARWFCRQGSAFWWAVPLLGYYAYHPGPWWRPMDRREPRCDTCGAPITTGLMAAFCPLADDCELLPPDEAGREFMREMRQSEGA